jgi:hypothetical protein
VSTRPSPHRDLLLTLALSRLEEQATQIRELKARAARTEQRLAAYEARKGPRDHQDRALHAAMADAWAGLPFKASSMMRRAKAVPGLAAALVASDITNERELGHLLRRLEGVELQGVTLERARRFWRFRTAE